MSKLLYLPSPSKTANAKHLKKPPPPNPPHPIHRPDPVANKSHSPAMKKAPPPSQDCCAPFKNHYLPSAVSSPTSQTRVPLPPQTACTPLQRPNPASPLAFLPTSTSLHAQVVRRVGARKTSALTLPIVVILQRRRSSPVSSMPKTPPHGKPVLKTPRRAVFSVLNTRTLLRRCRICSPTLTGT